MTKFFYCNSFYSWNYFFFLQIIIFFYVLPLKLWQSITRVRQNSLKINGFGFVPKWQTSIEFGPNQISVYCLFFDLLRMSKNVSVCHAVAIFMTSPTTVSILKSFTFIIDHTCISLLFSFFFLNTSFNKTASTITCF